MSVFKFANYAPFLKIKTKQAELVPFKFNYYQDKLNAMIEADKAAGIPIRYIILKCRQVGGSTFGSAYNYHSTATDEFKNARVVAHDKDSTNNLFNMYKLFWEASPDHLRPMRRYSNAKEIVFENPDDSTRKGNPGLRSSITVDTANNLAAGRSSTTHHLHISELAFWKNASTVLTGLLQSVPLIPNSSIIIESTANGMGGDGAEFWKRCVQAENKENDFRFIFFKWTDNPEYEKDHGLFFNLTSEEVALRELHPELSNRKLAWRRYKIKNEMGSALIDPYDQFKQEYPLIPEEAFLASGRPVFNQVMISKALKRVRDLPFKRGYMSTNHSLAESSKGPLKLYDNPVKDAKYAIGADVAEGIEGGDFSTMVGLDKNYNQVFSYKGHIDPDLFGKQLKLCGTTYNTALLGVEINNHGHSVMNTLKRENYTNLYTRTVWDERASQYTKKIGWHTNTKTKPFMLDEFIRLFREGQVKVNDIDLLLEMSTVQYNADGSVNLNGKDLVVAMCIAIQSVNQVPTHDTGVKVNKTKDPMQMSLEERLKYLKRNKREQKSETYFG